MLTVTETVADWPAPNVTLDGVTLALAAVPVTPAVKVSAAVALQVCFALVTLVIVTSMVFD